MEMRKSHLGAWSLGEEGEGVGVDGGNDKMEGRNGLERAWKVEKEGKSEDFLRKIFK